jgi:hypothetical protein
MIVRKMLPQDFDSVINLSNYYIEEAELESTWDSDVWFDNVRKSSTLAEYCFFVALDNQRPVGWISGYANIISDWNKDINAHIQTIYLLKNYRTPENLQMLFNSFKDWALLINSNTISFMDHEIDYFNNKFQSDISKAKTLYIKEL